MNPIGSIGSIGSLGEHFLKWLGGWAGPNDPHRGEPFGFKRFPISAKKRQNHGLIDSAGMIIFLRGSFWIPWGTFKEMGVEGSFGRP